MKKSERPVLYIGLAHDFTVPPVDLDCFEVWTCNGGCRNIPEEHLDIVFDMHDWEASNYYPKYLDELKRPHKYKVVTPYENKDIPNNEMFSLEDACKLFGYFLKSTHAYIVAYAVLQSKRDLFIFGHNNTEFYRHPEMGFAFYQAIGRARGYGTQVHICNQHTAEDDSFYGYQPFRWQDSDMMRRGGKYDTRGFVIK